MQPNIYKLRGMLARKRVLQEEHKQLSVALDARFVIGGHVAAEYTPESERLLLTTTNMSIEDMTSLRDWLNELLEPHDEIGGGIGANIRTEGGS